MTDLAYTVAAAWMLLAAAAIAAIAHVNRPPEPPRIPRPRTSTDDHIDQSIYLANSHKDQT